ncbi:MAG: hypothetical protein JO134_21530 [Xanthobacteraceae bacterium]|nr:hypothetical protein [Xanthobacteraceae bacterium]
MKASALLTIAAAVSLLGMRVPGVASPNTDLSVPRFPPLVLYTARGTGGCGDGCDEWIAAEGGFDIGSAERLRTFLSQFSGPVPPIYFQSPGGIQEEAIAIGRLMREHGVTAGVGRTLPYGCAPAKEGEDRCLAIKRSGLPLAAELRSTGSSCSSACVYALLGAQVRLVPPDARLGVHASRRVRLYPDGRVTRLPGDDQTQLAQATNELKRYVQEMGIDVALIDTAFKTKFSDAYFLTRSEIVQFGIDTRTFQETRWTVLDAASRRPSVFKLVVETRGDEGATTSLIQLACASAGEIRIGYVRAAAPNEIAPALVRAIAGEQRKTFARPGPAVRVTGLDNDTPYEPRSVSARPEFFEAAISAGRMVISESSLRPDSPHVLRLATAGLPEAIAALRKSCTLQSMASVR